MRHCFSVLHFYSMLWNTRKIPEKLSRLCFLPGEIKRYYIIFPHFLAYKFPFKFLQWLPLHLLYRILVFHLYFKAPHSTSPSCVSALLSYSKPPAGCALLTPLFLKLLHNLLSWFFLNAATFTQKIHSSSWAPTSLFHWIISIQYFFSKLIKEV